MAHPRRWLHHMTRPIVLRRGTSVALVVGPVLIAINRGDAILAGTLQSGDWLRMGLTVTVPFLVSVVSSAAARLQAERERDAPRP